MKMQNTAAKMVTSLNTAGDQRAELTRVVMGCWVVVMECRVVVMGCRVVSRVETWK